MTVTRRGRGSRTGRVVSGARKVTHVAKAASGGGRGRSASAQVEAQNIALLGPWLGLLAGAVVGQLVHASFQAVGDLIWLAYTGLAGATGLVAYAAWHTTKSRSSLALGHTLATVIGSGIWLMFAATTGLFHMDYVSWWLWRLPIPEHPTFDLWWMFGGAAAIIWNIRQGVGREHAKDAQNAPEDAWSEAGVPGVKGSVRKVNEFKMQGILTLPPGMTVENIQGAIRSIESSQGWPRKSTRILPAPGPAILGQRERALAVVMIKDPLAGAVPWPGLQIKRGMNLMSLIPLSVDSDGDEGGLWVARPEGTKHTLIQGMTGSGKLLTISTPIPTPHGWTTMGEIKVGDELFDDKGNVCRVTEAFNIQRNHPLLEIEFSDGSTIIAGPEHLWYTEDSRARLASGLNRRLEHKRKRQPAVTVEAASQLRTLANEKSEITLYEACGIAGVSVLGSISRRVLKRVSSCGREQVWVPYQGRPPVSKPGPFLYPAVELVEALIEEGSKLLHDQRHRHVKGQVRTTQEIADSIHPAGGAARAKHWNHSIPVAKALQLPEADLPVPPYVLGAWLGDGSSQGGSITTDDPEILDFIREDGFVVGEEYLTRGEPTKQYAVFGLVTALRQIGIVPRGKGRKFIPAQYLRSSESQRRALLAGLLDTDGTPEPSGAAVFTSTTKRLADDVLELVLSLGYRATVTEGDAKINGRFISKAWDVAFTTSDEIFRLSRKIQVHKERTLRHNPEKTGHRYIVAVRPALPGSARCIAVDSPSHLFLAGRNMIPTHNSEGEKPLILYTAALGATNIIIDTVKKTQTYGPLADALHWFVTDEGLAKAVIRRIANEMIPARTEYLAQEGLAQWSLKSKLSLIRLHIEEAWALVDTDEITNIALAARSAGIQLTLSLQRASHDMISTTVREQLGTRRCYGLGGGFGTMVLDDEVIEAGADPQKWKDTAPGMHYMERGGMTLDEKTIERRAYYDSGEITFAQAAKQIASKLKPMDEISARSMGPLWANRQTPLQVVANVGVVRNVTKRTGEALKEAADDVSTSMADRVKNYVRNHPANGTSSEVPEVAEVFKAQVEEEVPEPPSPPVSSDAVVPADVLGMLAQLSGATPEEMQEALKIYVARQGNVQDIIDGVAETDEGPDMHVVDSDDYVETERSGDGSQVVIRSPGLEDMIIDYGENAPSEEDLQVLDRIDPDVPLPQRPEDRPPLRLGVPSENAWTKDQFDAALMKRFNDLKAADRVVVNGGDFADVIAEAGWARTIIYPRLRSWERELGIVTETPEGFIIVRE